MTSDSLEWRQARQWLITSEVIPVTHRITKPDVDLVDFARSLRDGVFLCSLLNTLKPGCIPNSDWNPKPLMQHSYLRNIAAFLQACRSKFNISDSDLFSDSDLYDVDNFQKVMHVLSLLSHTPEALSQGWVPFPKAESRHSNHSNQSEVYASLRDIGMDRLYANMDELYSQVPQEEADPYGYGDETIYDSICYYRSPQVGATDVDEKRTNILNELYETEKSYLTVLELISQDFYSSLVDHITSEDAELLFSAVKALYPVHCALLEGFKKCVEFGKTDVAKCFLDVETDLLNYGKYAARLPMAVDKAKQLATRSDTCRLIQSCQERSQQRFPLSDLLSVPIQRFLKYPLLTKELLKCAKKATVPNQADIKSLETVIAKVEDIARYINSSRGDFETMKQIEEVEQSLVDYRGMPLLHCGRYIFDGELRIRPADQNATKPKWAFLFDKVMLLCRKVTRLGFDVRYSPKHIFTVSTLSVDPVLVPNPKGGKFSFAFRLAVKGQGEFLAHAKTEELKSQWIDAINHAKEMSSPRDGKKGFHSFELHTFDHPKTCDACHKLLHGCYFQGYICPSCSRASHRECLKDVEHCSAVKVQFPPSLPPTKKVGQVFIAKQKYDAIGTRSNHVLSFEKGEELEVLAPTPGAEWVEAISLVTGYRGEVPFSFLTRKDPVDPTEDKLRNYPWYLGKKSRIDAEQALHRMQDGVFLIRESDVRPGEYAIALKWNRVPKHIKVSKHADTRKFYVSDVCEFLSVEELVAYYQHNSLGSSFPGVDTTLRCPYRDMVEGGGSVRTRSASATPAPLVPSPRTMGRANSPTSTNSSQPSERWAEVLFAFTAEYPDELTIDRYDRIRIVETDTNKLGWWLGECNGKTGLFPSNYVRDLAS